MKPIKVGTYQLGFRWVELWISPLSSGGEFWRFPGHPEKGLPAKILVGIKDNALYYSWGVLLHEAQELILCDLGLRFSSTNNFCEHASDSYIFLMDHNQFTEVAARLGAFVDAVHDDFRKAYRKAKRVKVRRGRKS